MDITGARWRLRSAEAVLKLRSLHSSGDTEVLLSVSQGPRADAEPSFTDGEPRLSKSCLTRLNVVLKELHPIEFLFDTACAKYGLNLKKRGKAEKPATTTFKRPRSQLDLFSEN
jgi:hypothetical protein